MSCRNQRKLQNFYVPMKKEIRKIGKDGNKTVETISYKIKLIDSGKELKLKVKNVIIFLNMKVSRTI